MSDCTMDVVIHKAETCIERQRLPIPLIIIELIH